jgi:hypothetical protein
MAIISHGRQMGKSYVNNLIQNWYQSMAPAPTIKWQRLPGLKLKAYHDGSANFGFSEEDMDPIQHWCWTNMPTVKRMSFDTFLFKSEKQITMFLMKWS